MRNGTRPGPLAIFYGWPSLVNGSAGDVERAARHFRSFEAAVLGEATPTPAGDPRAADVVARLRGCCRVYGYVSLGRGPGQPGWSCAELRVRLAGWARWGAAGTLLDCAGRDFGVSPQRLAWAVDAAHELGLSVVVNAWDPLDLPASGGHLQPGDGYLAENDVLRRGTLRPPDAYRDRLARVERCRQALGVAIWATGTTAPPAAPTYRADVVGRVVRAWLDAGARPPDLLALADPLYGASDNRMPLPCRCAAEPHPPGGSAPCRWR